ncbi:hypothetical protein KSC_016570 [Ktedonobacter sp. SOSP1-52]|nr:hypothetical protein KSC_016570 [Ktedonobacter sp. SOSP1-52]
MWLKASKTSFSPEFSSQLVRERPESDELDSPHHLFLQTIAMDGPLAVSSSAQQACDGEQASWRWKEEAMGAVRGGEGPLCDH